VFPVREAVIQKALTANKPSHFLSIRVALIGAGHNGNRIDRKQAKGVPLLRLGRRGGANHFSHFAQSSHLTVGRDLLE